MQRLLAFVGAVVLVMAACQSNPATPATSAGPTSAVASPTAAATEAPSPTPDVSQLFSAQMLTATKAQMTLTGTFNVGEQIGDVSGQLTFVGGDSDQSMTISIAGSTSTTHSIHVGSDGFTKVGDGPWFKDLVAPKAGQDVRSVLKALTSLVDKGVEQHDGVAAHRLELATGTVVTPAQFGLSDPRIVSPTINLVFYADDTGKPLAMVVTVAWSQTVNGTAVPVTMTVDFAFTQLGGALTVAPPDNVWNVYTSTRYHYRMGYPSDWTTYLKDKTYDYFNSATGAFAFATRTSSKGFSLNAIASSEVSVDKAKLHATGVTNVAYKLAGAPARLITFHATINGTKSVVYEVIAVKSGYAYDVAWISPTGHEAVDLATFKAMVGSFAFV